MIVRSETGSLLLITQPDHAALARRIMEQAIPLARTTRRDSILYAVAEHDNGWREPDMAPSVDPATGELQDFVSAPVDVRQAVWPRGVARLAADPWAAALVAQHALTVYGRLRTRPEWEAFFGEMERARDTYLHKAAANLDELRRGYVFLRLGDLASLTFCNGWTKEQRYEGWTIRLDGARLLITPDPFGGRDVPLAVTARKLPNQRFASDADAAAAYRSAKEVTCSGMAVGVPEPRDEVRIEATE
ncbi:MAG: DUF3891 family protein [Luteitalea sp.]|nr:DUF3891 family protein [Luteitalea sp.]